MRARASSCVCHAVNGVNSSGSREMRVVQDHEKMKNEMNPTELKLKTNNMLNLRDELLMISVSCLLVPFAEELLKI